MLINALSRSLTVLFFGKISSLDSNLYLENDLDVTNISGCLSLAFNLRLRLFKLDIIVFEAGKPLSVISKAVGQAG